MDEIQICDNCGQPLIATNEYDENGNEYYRCSQNCNSDTQFAPEPATGKSSTLDKVTDHYVSITHIDFCFRARPHLVPTSNDPKGYWLISEILPAGSAIVWRKRTDGRWARITPSYNRNDDTAVQLGGLVKTPGDPLAAGQIHARLEAMLSEHMKKNNKTEKPYVYW